MLGACVGTPSLDNSGAPSFGALQEMCGAPPVDYGNDAQAVYSTFFDAYVAYRRGGLSKEQLLRVPGGDRAAAQRRYMSNPQGRRRKARGRILPRSARRRL